MPPDLIAEYGREVERIFGEDLVSLTVYGSHAGGTPSPGAEVFLLLVVRVLRPEALERFRAMAHRYARRGIPPPPVVTEAFLRESADVFPLEYLDIAARRRVVAGRDVIAGIAISTENLRHQVEFEIKGKLLSLRRAYLTTFGDRALSRLLTEAVAPVLSVARGLLLLGGQDAPTGKEEILAALEARFGVALPALGQALAARRSGRFASLPGEKLIHPFLEEVERLCSIADRGGAS